MGGLPSVTYGHFVLPSSGEIRGFRDEEEKLYTLKYRRDHDKIEIKYNKSQIKRNYTVFLDVFRIIYNIQRTTVL